VARLTSAWRRLRPLLGERAGPIAVLAGAALVAGLAEAGVLALVAQVAVAMVAGRAAIDAQLGPVGFHLAVATALFAALALGLGRFLLSIVVGWLPARISADVQARLRRDLFGAYSRASWSQQADDPDGHLQELMTNQLNQASLAVVNVTTLLSSAAMLAALVVAAFVLSVPVALAVLVGGAGMFGLLRPFHHFAKAGARDLSAANVEHAGGVSESVHMAEETQVFGAAVARRAHMDGLIETARDAFFRFQLGARMIQSTYQSVVLLLLIAGLAGLYLAGLGNLPALGAAVLMLIRAANYGQQGQSSYVALNQMVPYLDRIEKAVARYEATAAPRGERPLPAIRTLAFLNVGFAYRGRGPLLRGVTFEIHAGDAVGIVGPSGAGKSTLVQLLLRLREPAAGAYLVNGEPISAFSRADWQARVAYVPQEPRVFRGTVADNIRFFRQLDDEAVRRAALAAHIHDEILAMPAGYDTVIGQRADAVSGGQRQRICLARALAGEPEVLVLDEPTSSLDPVSEAAVRASLDDLRGKVTLFVVAHGPSLVRDWDLSLAVCDGQIVPTASAPSGALVSGAVSRMRLLEKVGR
jgi:ABC-type multidrug transport system fused ATPase/permease subunit